MNSIAPNFFVRDMDETLAFYEKLGFQLTARVPDEGSPVWAMMMAGEVTFMFQVFESLGEELPQISREIGASVLFYISMKDIKGFFEKVEPTGAVIKGLKRTFYNATEFTILDNNGYVLTFAEHEGQETGAAD